MPGNKYLYSNQYVQTKQHSDQVQLCIVTARSGSPQIMPCMSLVLLIIGASLSEPHINGTAMCAVYGI